MFCGCSECIRRVCEFVLKLWIYNLVANSKSTSIQVGDIVSEGAGSKQDVRKGATAILRRKYDKRIPQVSKSYARRASQHHESHRSDGVFSSCHTKKYCVGYRRPSPQLDTNLSTSLRTRNAQYEPVVLRRIHISTSCTIFASRYMAKHHMPSAGKRKQQPKCLWLRSSDATDSMPGLSISPLVHHLIEPLEAGGWRLRPKFTQGVDSPNQTSASWI